MKHEDFVAAHAAGALRLRVDRDGAVRLVSSSLLLPFVLLPVLGLAVALALSGSLFLGIVVFLLALVLRYAVRASSQGFVLARALRNPVFYEQARAAGVLRVEPD